jgi:fatty-acyl-CoA synthase
MTGKPTAGAQTGRQVAGSWIAHHARVRGNQLAMVEVETERHYSYREIDNRSEALAAHLESAGVGSGDRVVILSPNSTRVFEVAEACLRVGAVMVPLNWRLSTVELEGIVADCSPRALISDSEFAHIHQRMRAAAPSSCDLVWGGDPDTYEAVVTSGAQRHHSHAGASADPWVIIYTSGSTGHPKGVVHTRDSVRANMDNSTLSGQVGADSACLTVLPTFHVAGLNLFANAALFHGGTVHVMRQFDAGTALELLSASGPGITHFCGVPANYQFMAALPLFDQTTLAPFVAAVGGSPVPNSLVSLWNGRGAKVMTVFGITEAGSTVLTTIPGEVAMGGVVGRPALHCEVEIRDPNGHVVPAGVIGELFVRGEALAAQYWQNAQATVAAFDAGWLRTGDAARADATGVVSIVDRWTDMYISGGENVYPAEVENVLHDHPAVSQAAVVGVPDDRWGEHGHAYVVLRPGASATPQDLRAWCRDLLATFKVPRDITLIPELPRNATGKVLKHQLR